MSAKSTKNMIYETIVRLAEERTLEKVTVVDIIEEMGIARQTFYYYYHSIPEVYFNRMLVTVPTDEPVGRDILFALRKINAFCAAVEKEKDVSVQFFRVYADELCDMMHDLFLGFITRAIQSTYGRDIPQRSLATISEFHADGYIGVIRKWVIEGMDGGQPIISVIKDAWASMIMSDAVESIRNTFVNERTLRSAEPP